MPRSFRSRLLVGTALWIVGALLASAMTLAQLYRGQIASLFEDELRGHLEELIGLAEVDADGHPRLRHPLIDPRFDNAGTGFFWQIEAGGGQLARSASLGAASLPRREHAPRGDGNDPIEAAGPSGPVKMLVGRKPISGSEALLVAIAAESRVFEETAHRFDRALVVSFVLLGLGLVAAAWAAAAFALKPVGRVRAALVAIHTGKATHMPADLPLEVAGLARDLNAMIDTNQQILRRARADAGRLAHGLKTPLAILLAEAHRLAEEGHGEAARVVSEQCERMRRQIDFQLARGSESGGGAVSPAAVTVIGAAARAVIVAISALYHDRGLDFALDGDVDAVAACDPRDADELLGNLLDNAGKWARSRVHLSIAALPGGGVRVCVEDDGPGLPASARETVFMSGSRLDESKPGAGLGLAIVRDLVARYRGRVWMETSPLGGAAACLELPGPGPAARGEGRTPTQSPRAVSLAGEL